MPKLSIESICGFNSSLLSDTCMNIENRSQFEALFSGDQLEQTRVLCNQPLKDDCLYRSCSDRSLGVHNTYFHGAGSEDSLTCNAYPFMYADAFANRFGPTDVWIAKCLFLVDFIRVKPRPGNRRAMLMGIVMGCINGVFGAILVGLVSLVMAQ